MTMETKFIAIDEFKADEDTRTIEGYGSVYDFTDSQNDIVLRGAFAKSLRGKMPVMLWQHKQDMIPGMWDVAEETDKGLLMRGRIYKGASVMGIDVYDLLKDKAIKGLSIGYTPKRQEFDRDKGTRKLLEVELHEVSLVTFPANDRAKVTRVKAAVEDAQKAAKALKDAIDLHQKHMDGTEPTTGEAGERSQMRMMKMMKKAYAFLTDAEDGDMEGMGKSALMTERAFEEFLRDVGELSQKEAKLVVSEGYRALLKHRDGGADEAQEKLQTRLRDLFNQFKQ